MSTNTMCLKAVFRHFWLMERIFFQNWQNMHDISQKLSVHSIVFLGTLTPRPIAFSTYVHINQYKTTNVNHSSTKSQSAAELGTAQHRWKQLWDTGTKSPETLMSWHKVFGKYHAYFAGFENISAPLAKNDWKLTNQYFFNFHWIRLIELELANQRTKQK